MIPCRLSKLEARSSAAAHQLILDVGVPQAQAVQVMQQMLVDDSELPGQHTAHVDVGGVGLQQTRSVQQGLWKG